MLSAPMLPEPSLRMQVGHSLRCIGSRPSQVRKTSRPGDPFVVDCEVSI